jgi:hypothetical protein
MTQQEGEKKVKALQKEFLIWIEEHPALSLLDPDDFDRLRRSVFRGTFQAFRLGIVGLDAAENNNIRKYFFHWLDDTGLYLEEYHPDVTTHCFLTSLEAFRVGAVVSATKKREFHAEVYDR